MSLRDDLAGVLARDPRYTIQAYAFLFESLEFTKSRKKRSQARPEAGARHRHAPATSPGASFARDSAAWPRIITGSWR